jgi:hypothetical protein
MANECKLEFTAVPNEIPNECDMATEMVPEEFENDHQLSKYSTEWRRKRQSRELPRDDDRDLTATDITDEGLHMEIE